MQKIKPLTSYLLFFAVLHLVVPAIPFLMKDGAAATLTLWTMVFPLAAIVVTAFYTYRNGFSGYYLLLQPTLFLLSSVVYPLPMRMDDATGGMITLSPFMYALFYLICSIFAATSGTYFHKTFRKKN